MSWLAWLEQGLLGASWWQLLACGLLATHITIVCVTIYLHRCQAHHALRLHPLAAHFFRFWLWLTTGMVTREWVAIHRCHHAHCESARDPHSPRVLGIRTVLWRGAELYRAAAQDRHLLQRYGAGTPDDWVERHLYSKYAWQGVGLLLILDVVLFGARGITLWAVQMLWIPFLAAGVINGLGHYLGYRNYDCKEAATNILPLGLLVGGEELHNNHHTFPTSAKLSARWFEFDIGWGYIRLLSWLGLATVRGVPHALTRQRWQTVPTHATLRQVLANRALLIRQLTRATLLLHRSEQHWSPLRPARGKYGRTCRLLQRDPAHLSSSEARTLEQLLRHSRALQQMQQARRELELLWSSASASPEQLLELLQSWCRRGQLSGVAQLRRFAGQLAQYG